MHTDGKFEYFRFITAVTPRSVFYYYKAEMLKFKYVHKKEIFLFKVDRALFVICINEFN